jgi:universal stress protein A
MKTSSISRTGKKQRLVRTIIVPVDFSDCSLAGLKYAIRMAREIGARIVLLHVADLGPVMMSAGDYGSLAHTKAARHRCGDQMESFLKLVDLTGVRIDTSAVAGYCPDAIYQAAAEEGADLIVISTHGRTGLRHALLGSVAEATVRHSPCPVLVVPSFPGRRKKSVGENARELSRSEKLLAGVV